MLVLVREINPDEYNIFIKNGEAAGESIKDWHVHVIAGNKGDVENPRGGVRWVIANQANYWDTKRP